MQERTLLTVLDGDTCDGQVRLAGYLRDDYDKARLALRRCIQVLPPCSSVSLCIVVCASARVRAHAREDRRARARLMAARHTVVARWRRASGGGCVGD